MMWDLSGGRRSPHPSATGPPPPFPTPQHFAPPSSPAPPGRPGSNAATYGSSHAPTLPFGYPVGQVPSTSRSDSFGQTYDRQHHQAYEQYQTARGLPFPAANSYGQISPSQMQYTSQQTIVVHRSKHHSKSKHSSGNRLRRHSHSGGMPVAMPAVPQVPIYSSGHGSGSKTHLKPALVHHSTSSYNLSSSYQGHRPSHSQPHVAFQVPSSSSSKPKPRPSKSPSHARQPCVHYSKCTGRRKALCIGINYTGQRNELRGCVNDAKRMRKFLISHGYPPEDVILLTDDAKDPRALPTKKNILGCMKWLVKGAQPNDALFFHYSGHGGQTPDLDGDELDGHDEVIFPLDFKKSGHITDDEMHDIMVRPLPDDCRLTALFDACHSGTVLDLPYIYSSHGRLKGSHITDRAMRSKATNADVISWSGCKDGQTSADTFQGGVAVGAMSHAFTTSLASNPNQTYQELLRSIRLILHPRYSQKPQLGSSHHIDTTLKFVF